MRRCCNEAVEAAGFAPGRKKINAPGTHLAIAGALCRTLCRGRCGEHAALFEKLNPILDQEGTRDAYRLEVDLLPMVLEMRRRGIRIDQDAAEQARDLLLAKRDAALAEISAQLGAPVGMDEINSRKSGRHGPSSTRHRLSAHGEGQSVVHGRQIRLDGNACALAAAADRDREQIRSRRHQVSRRPHSQAHRRTGAFMPRSIRFAPMTAARARRGFRYSNPPLQQMPVSRQGVGAADPQRVPAGRRRELGQDRRLAAGISLHRALRSHAGPTKADEAAARYRNNPDTPTFTTWLPNGPGSTAMSAKSVNFAKMFGAGVRKFAEMIGKPEAEAHAIYDRYDRELPFVQQLSKRCQSTAAKQGYLELYDGARRHWDTWEARRCLA